MALMLYSHHHIHEQRLDNFYLDFWSRCRWVPNIGEPLLFIKHSLDQLNILDTEKKVLTLKSSIDLETLGNLNNIFFFKYSILNCRIHICCAE